MVIRVFGFEVIGLLVYLLVLIFIIGEFIIPMPQYYIKHREAKEVTLNEIIEKEVLNSGIKFDDRSFKILDSHGMHFNHLFLCSYEIDGIEEVRFLHFEKNIFGNMKPKYPLNGDNKIPAKSSRDDFYHAYVKDGIFAGYLVVAGFDAPSSELIFGLSKYRIEAIHQKGYFMWVEMAKEPWKSELIKFFLYGALVYIISRWQNDKIQPIKFYIKWKKGDKIIKCI